MWVCFHLLHSAVQFAEAIWQTLFEVIVHTRGYVYLSLVGNNDCFVGVNMNLLIITS